MTNQHTTKSAETLFRQKGQHSAPSGNDIETKAESMRVFENNPSTFSKNVSRYAFQSFKHAVRPSLFANPLDTLSSKAVAPRNMFAKKSFSSDFDNKRFDWVSQQSHDTPASIQHSSSEPALQKQSTTQTQKLDFTAFLHQLKRSDWLILEDLPDNPLDTIFENNGHKTRLFYHQHTQQLCLLTRTVSQWGMLAPSRSNTTTWFESSVAHTIEDFDTTSLASDDSDATVLWTVYLLSPRLANTGSPVADSSQPYTRYAQKADTELCEDDQALCQMMFEGRYHQSLSTAGFIGYYQSLPASLALPNPADKALWLQHKADLIFAAFAHREECFKPLKHDFFNVLAQPLSTHHLHETLMWVQLSKALVESRLIHLASERQHLDHLLKQLAEQFQLLSQTCPNGPLQRRIEDAQIRFKTLMTDGLWRVQLHTQAEFVR